MADMTEIIKREGLPPNEATRIRQWELAVLEETEKLRMLKVYRTRKFRSKQPMHGDFETFCRILNYLRIPLHFPAQSLRSFGRLFSVFLPPLYAPYYAELAFSLNSLAVGIIFACLTSLALTGLFESGIQMEE
jgi:hypothetical protein